MQFTIILAGLLSLALASPAPAPGQKFSIDVAALKEAVASDTLESSSFLNVVETRDTSTSLAARDLVRRDCPGPNGYCEGGICRRTECYPLRYGGYCVEYTYSDNKC